MTVQSKKKIIVGFALMVLSLGTVAVGRRQPALGGDAPAYRQIGSPRARVVLTEYSDLQCPKCAQAVATVKGLLDSYPNDLRVVFHHAPLKQHAWSNVAAQASEAAGFQGKFWEYIELVFARQSDWSKMDNPKQAFVQYALEVGLKQDDFVKDLESPRVAEIVRREKAQSDAQGIPATPTFFVNDRMLVGDSQLAANGVRFIERELGR